MFDETGSADGLFNDDEAFHLIQELSANTPDAIRRQRAHFRLSIKAELIAQPGNASDMLKLKVKGVTGDVSEGGCSAIFPIPMQVGDIYRLQFDRSSLDLPLVFARCVRCRLVREDAFETGFAFFAHICLPEKLAASAEAS
jgi:hypothetical protein